VSKLKWLECYKKQNKFHVKSFSSFSVTNPKSFGDSNELCEAIYLLRVKAHAAEILVGRIRTCVRLCS